MYIYKPIHGNCPSRTFLPRMTAGGFREADSFFVFVFDVLLMKAEMVWGLKKQGWLWSDITGVADRMVRFTKGVLKIFLNWFLDPNLEILHLWS